MQLVSTQDWAFYVEVRKELTCFLLKTTVACTLGVVIRELQVFKKILLVDPRALER